MNCDEKRSKQELVAEIERLRRENRELREMQRDRNRFRHAETVLVVDDNDEARNVVVTMLEDLNYRTIESDSIQNAVELFTEKRHTIDLVLSDVVMPDGSGPEMVEQMRTQDPGIRVVFMSGYAEEEIVHDDVFKVQHSDAAFLKKPFSMKSLETVLKNKLKKDGGADAR